MERKIKELNMKPELKEIIVQDLRVRQRESKDMTAWFNNIKSVLFPSSLKCSALRNGKWEDCIVTGRLADDGSGRLSMTVLFPDSTIVKAGGRKSSFLTEEYIKELDKKKSFSVKKYDALRS